MQSNINSADTVWVLVSTVLVLLMTPALGLFYAGMARAKNVLNILMQSFISISVVTVIWSVVGYSLAFSKGNSFIGGSDYFFLKGVGQDSLTLNGAGLTIPHIAFMAFQMMFAIITPALISGAVVERMKFSAYVAFIALWSLLVYVPVAHMVWGEGGLFVGKALDFAGGTVVHITSGFSALVLALLMGKRRLNHNDDTRPHNLPMVLIGTGLVWFGWFGFNAGSALAANGVAALAFINTQVATGAALIGWLVLEKIRDGHATSLGAASGAVAGLVAITPACAFVAPWAAVVIGFIAGMLCALAVGLKFKFNFDDSLDVVGVHLIGGLWGCISIGFFGSKAINSIGLNGLLYGGGTELLGKQVFGALFVLTYSFLVTLILGLIIEKTIGFRIKSDSEISGVDVSEHAETAYMEVA